MTAADAQRRYERLLLNLLDDAEAEGHPYPELVAIDRFCRIHGRYDTEDE